MPKKAFSSIKGAHVKDVLKVESPRLDGKMPGLRAIKLVGIKSAFHMCRFYGLGSMENRKATSRHTTEVK